MHGSGSLSVAFEGPEQGFGGKNCQNGSRGKPCLNYPKYHLLSVALSDISWTSCACWASHKISPVVSEQKMPCYIISPTYEPIGLVELEITENMTSVSIYVQ